MADQYIDSMLGQGETILAQGRQHWMALIRFALQPILVFLAAIACFAIGVWLEPSGDGLFDQIFRWIDTLLGLVTAGLFILAIVWFPLQCIRWLKRRYLITDRRVLYVEGWLRRNSMDAGLSMITDVTFRQTFLGRHMGFADLVIATAANRPLHFRDIRDAVDFKKAIMAAQQGTVVARADTILQQGGHAPVEAGDAAAAVATGIPASVAVTHEPPPEPVAPWDGGDVPQIAEDDLPPADPLIFGDVAVETPEVETPEVAAPAVETPAVETPEVAAPAVETPAVAELAPPAVDTPAVAELAPPAVDTPEVAQTAATEAPNGVEAVTESLARLADLRDSGTITEADYEAKKQDLLDRL